MRELLATLLTVSLGCGCNLIAPFDPEDQPVRPSYGDAGDNDEAAIDGSPDGSTDSSVESGPCVPDCADRSCGPDGCGGTCGGCSGDAVCVACSPFDRSCPAPYRCAPPGPEQWVYLRTNTSFSIGSPPGEAGRELNEGQREVALTYDLVILSTEVTQEMSLLLFDGREPSFFSRSGEGGPCGRQCPVEHLSWVDAVLMTNRLSESAGLGPCYECEGDDGVIACSLAEGLSSPQECRGYRLPTEAEWEYAARAESRTATYVGDLTPEQLGCDPGRPVLDGAAWFCGNAEGITHPVATTTPNAFGLYDVLGNVFEWCHDIYSDSAEALPTQDPFGPATGTRHVYRGGAWDEPAENLRAASRRGAEGDDRSAFIGLRPVRTVQQTTGPR